MIEFLSSWACNVTISVIVVTIIEMILPEGKNTKYIKTVIGIYILLVVLEPISNKLLNTNIEFENIFSNYNLKSKEVASLETQESIKELYLNNLKTDISCKLKERGYEVIDIDLKINEKIDNIKLSIKKTDTDNIKKIEINKKEEKITASEIKELKEYISTTYNIQQKNILIN